jgi:hypothetical protein
MDEIWSSDLERRLAPFVSTGSEERPQEIHLQHTHIASVFVDDEGSRPAPTGPHRNMNESALFQQLNTALIGVLGRRLSTRCPQDKVNPRFRGVPPEHFGTSDLT